MFLLVELINIAVRYTRTEERNELHDVRKYGKYSRQYGLMLSVVTGTNYYNAIYHYRHNNASRRKSWLSSLSATGRVIDLVVPTADEVDDAGSGLLLGVLGIQRLREGHG